MTDKEKLVLKKIGKAKSVINEIQNLLQFGYYNTAVNRLYYASFYAVQALLANTDIFPKSHKGVLNMFSLHFVRENKIPVQLSDFYAVIFNERQLADYDDDSEFDKETAEAYFSLATEFLAYIEKLLDKK